MFTNCWIFIYIDMDVYMYRKGLSKINLWLEQVEACTINSNFSLSCCIDNLFACKYSKRWKENSVTRLVLF